MHRPSPRGLAAPRAALVVLALVGATRVHAQDASGASSLPLLASPVAITGMTYDFGARYFLSSGHSHYTLQDTTGTTNVSRLDFFTHTTNSGEFYGRFDLPVGFFLKGAVGVSGQNSNGNLRDQDFASPTFAYSDTVSSIQGGNIAYGNVDVGYTFLRRPNVTLGGFLGYEHLSESYDARGCEQTAGNQDVCAPGDVAGGLLTIQERMSWNGVRVGLEGHYRATPRLTLSAEGAFLPYVSLNGADDHVLRQYASAPVIGGQNACDLAPGSCFAGATPQTGHGMGYQLEGSVNYAIFRNWTVGLGGRFWDMWAKGQDRFDVSAVPLGLFPPQVVRFESIRFGGFVQSGVRF